MVDWTGSNAAAWAQAVLSGLAILYSGRLAYGQSRSAKREKIDTYVALLYEADEAAECAVEVLRDAANESVEVVAPPMDFAGLERSFREVPFNEVPDHRLVRVLRSAAFSCFQLSLRYDKVVDGTTRVCTFHFELAESEAKTIRALRLEAEAISNSYMTLPARAMYFAWRMKISAIGALRPHKIESPRDRES
ncbi:hypothetical protein [Stenotrophomonas maltophilia]|uniref:hypothetical protein n=1 Tax=Stenotrophomonas maltophilia TaxID=40324 RepID=UPI0022F3DA41|nr:hypothetical protein [Stenotrophomonas maltophilia]MDA5343813.1 hypothetical protein [Stenotrophomonas maltophilia]